MRLTGAATLIACEVGYFAGEDIEVALSVEPFWANVADKLAYRLLDGAMLLPPSALTRRQRRRCPGGHRGAGNTMTLAERWAGTILGESAMSAMEAGRRFCALIRARRVKPLLAVVHTFSSHNLLLR